MIVKFKGSIRYHGQDGDNEISVASGKEVEVSDAKAKQLLTDFPKDWELVTVKKTDKK